MAFTNFEKQQLANAREEVKKGTAGAAEAVARLEAAQKQSQQDAIKRQQQASGPLSSYAQEVKDRMRSGQSYEQATSGAAERREVTSRDEYGVPTYGEKAPDPALLLQQQMAAQMAAEREALFNAQKQASINALRTAEQSALRGTARQRGEIGEQALSQRTGLKTESARAARSFSDYLAARGLGRSGAATQGRLAQQATLQTGLGQARAQEQELIGRVGEQEADIRAQTAAGIAQAEQTAQAQEAQARLAELQAQQQQQIQLQQLEAQRQFEAQQFQQKQALEQARYEADIALEDARFRRDSAEEERILRLKSQLDREEAQLAASLRSSGGGGGTGGLTFSQSRQVFNDQVGQYTSGIDAILGRLGSYVGDRFVPASKDEQVSAIYSYLSQLENAGVDPTVIDTIANQYGVNPQSTRLGMTQSQALTPFRMPTFGTN